MSAKRFSRALLIAAVIAFFCSLRAHAQELPEQKIYFRVQMIPSVVVLNNPDGWYDEGEPFVDVPLQPKEAYVFTEDLRTSDEEVFLPAGMQMVSMAASYPILCSHIERDPSFMSFPKRFCIGDFDRDGQFERAWKLKVGQPAWEFRGRVPNDALSISSPQLQPISPSQLANLPRLEIYSNHMALRRRPRDGSAPYWEAFVRVKVVSGGDRNTFFCLLQNGYCVGYTRNTLLGLGSMMMRVSDVQDEKIRVELVRNFDGVDLRELTFDPS